LNSKQIFLRDFAGGKPIGSDMRLRFKMGSVMFWNFVRKEIAVHILTARFAVVFALAVVLAVVSTLVMTGDYTLRMDNWRLLTQQDQPGNLVKQPAPMSVFVKGLDERAGRALTISGVIWVGSSQDAVNRLFALFRQIDLHFVLAVIISLAAILFSFDQVSGEKQGQTLKLLLVGSCGRGMILAAKWVSAVILVALPTLVALLAALVLVQYAAPAALAGDTPLRLLLLGLLTLLQIAAFCALGLLLSSLTHRPASSLVFAILVWAVLVFVVPPVAEMAATRLAGGETMERREEDVKQAWIGGIFEYIRASGQHEGQGPGWARHTAAVATRLTAEYRDYLNIESRRLALMNLIGAVSPTGAFNAGAWAIAGTGQADALHFKSAAVRFLGVRARDRVIQSDIDNRASASPASFEPTRFNEYQRPLGQALVDDILPAMATLAAQALLLFLAAFFVFSRYDAR
jgi:ABC-type transport system involved in multi-copper enzyme maturation permease subunit